MGYRLAEHDASKATASELEAALAWEGAYGGDGALSDSWWMNVMVRGTSTNNQCAMRTGPRQVPTSFSTPMPQAADSTLHL